MSLLERDGLPPLDRDGLRDRVAQELSRALAGWAGELAGISPELSPMTEAVRAFVLDGGKRLRPAFGWWGWRGAGGAPRGPEADAVVRAVAALELVHACALVHDDVMDASATRRGAPSVHERFAALHREQGYDGSAAGFGRASAILVGDLLLIWADRLFTDCGRPAAQLAQARAAYDAMRTEVMAGQFLDVLAQCTPAVDVERAMRVARYKSATYTVQRPLHVGGLLAGAGVDLVACYTAYGIPVGEAFQLRDDILGVFGDPEVTGKPAGDDLREGKRTALVALTWRHGSPAQRRDVTQLLGDPGLDAGGVSVLREAIEGSGARAEVEEMISSRLERGLAALAAGPVDPEAIDVLAALATSAARRTA